MLIQNTLRNFTVDHLIELRSSDISERKLEKISLGKTQLPNVCFIIYLDKTLFRTNKNIFVLTLKFPRLRVLRNLYLL